MYSMDESMFDVVELMEGAAAKVPVPADAERADNVVPSVVSNCSRATVVACVCADGTTLPPFVVVPGSGGRLPFVWRDMPDGTREKLPLAGVLKHDDAGVHRRDPPGFDAELWGDWAAFMVRQVGTVRPEENKILVLDGCRVHFNLDGLKALRAAKIWVFVLPSHLSFLMQLCDDRVRSSALRNVL
eukprot:TRINITY_DN15954_c0_g1_i1.p1 TRINITY_DN15954_c0_g1~~TRINITY_DN15954_c0_g1_i1.p1  ORF type:complete len:186 (-),score=45.81 TRINITY_DN15954_c0_g1_i1:35-592(-)